MILQQKKLFLEKNAILVLLWTGPEGLVVPVLKEAQKEKSARDYKGNTKVSGLSSQGDYSKGESTGGPLSLLTNLEVLEALMEHLLSIRREMAIIGIYRLFKQVVQTIPGELKKNSL